jgi:hypothetical protein
MKQREQLKVMQDLITRDDPKITGPKCDPAILNAGLRTEEVMRMTENTLEANN